MFSEEGAIGFLDTVGDRGSETDEVSIKVLQYSPLHQPGCV